jgi:hypothetical protein
VTKLISTLTLAVVGVIAVGAVGPGLARLISALVPLVLVAGIVAGVLMVLRYLTRP